MKKWISILFSHFSWGIFVVQKGQFIITTVILLKVFDVGFWYYIITPPAIVIITLIIGWIFDKYFKLEFQKKYYGKGFNFKT